MGRSGHSPTTRGSHADRSSGVTQLRREACREEAERAAGSHVADRLLDLLSSDDAFRSLFMSNPREALAQVGFVNETDLESPYWCFWGISKLASKRAIAEARCEIRNLLTSELSQTATQLDAGLTARQLLR